MNGFVSETKTKNHKKKRWKYTKILENKWENGDGGSAGAESAGPEFRRKEYNAEIVAN